MVDKSLNRYVWHRDVTPSRTPIFFYTVTSQGVISIVGDVFKKKKITKKTVEINCITLAAFLESGALTVEYNWLIVLEILGSGDVLAR